MKVKGKNILVEILQNSTWAAYACATTMTLDVVTDVIETSVAGSGRFATFIPSKISFSGTLEGFTDLGGSLSLYELRKKQLEGAMFRLRINRTAGSNSYIDEAEFFVTDSTDTSGHIGFSTFSITIQGTGKLTQNGGSGTPKVPYDLLYGFTNIDTTFPYVSASAQWSAIKTSIQDAIDNLNYKTLHVDDKNDDALVNFDEPGYWVRFILYPGTVPDFGFWSELYNPLQQNIGISNGGVSGVFSMDNIPAGRIIATRYQTAFTNKINFSR